MIILVANLLKQIEDVIILVANLLKQIEDRYIRLIERGFQNWIYDLWREQNEW